MPNTKLKECIEVLENLEQFTGGTAKERLLLAVKVLERLTEERVAKIIQDNISFTAEPVGVPHINITQVAKAVVRGLED